MLERKRLVVVESSLPGQTVVSLHSYTRNNKVVVCNGSNKIGIMFRTIGEKFYVDCGGSCGKTFKWSRSLGGWFWKKVN